MDRQLLDKYNVPAPRYTSYPTVPYWQDEIPTAEWWRDAVRAAYAEYAEISLYIHLPFCEKLCTYCGCHKRITRNHALEQPYVTALGREWALYRKQLPDRPVIREIHLGGGTPTFFHPAELDRLLGEIIGTARLHPEADLSFEAHPASTTEAHLRVLYRWGFRRISIGVQDFDPEILRIINRDQSYADVERVTRLARAIGYTSVNFDLIFGLPLQTPANIRDNVDKVRRLRPERIAFYSYAHVPWIKPSQRAYSEADLPTGGDKRTLYELGRELLEEAGYAEIGFDHFALPQDELYRAERAGTLHRNFMGYTPNYTRLSIGLGASAISDSWTGFVQNEKRIETYQDRIAAGELPFFRGHELSVEDAILRRHILNLMCRHQTDWRDPAHRTEALYAGLERLAEPEADGLIVRAPYSLRVTAAGQPFVRNICLALDAHFWARRPEGRLFSSVV